MFCEEKKYHPEVIFVYKTINVLFDWLNFFFYHDFPTLKKKKSAFICFWFLKWNAFASVETFAHASHWNFLLIVWSSWECSMSGVCLEAWGPAVITSFNTRFQHFTWNLHIPAGQCRGARSLIRALTVRRESDPRSPALSSCTTGRVRHACALWNHSLNEPLAHFGAVTGTVLV